MLRLFQWLDFRFVWGPTGPFLMRCASLGVVSLVCLSIAQAVFEPQPQMMRAAKPYVPQTEFLRGESLFNGRKTSSKTETLAEAQRCLAQAIYFEARSEPVAGWEAVADVVMNRAVSTNYPASICGVVFQGQYRRHKCQFSFACDGLSDRPKHRGLWRQALRVAGNKLVSFRAGPATAQATHYHADYVDPYWNRSMVKLTQIGRHIFYNDKRVGLRNTAF